jgi:uncharacterized protein YeaO (DUF488 family)
MLQQASVRQIRSGEITRQQGRVVIAMCFYPRGLRKELRDEYLRCLAPDPVLFRDWKRFERECGHEEAFARSHYEDRFALSEEALSHLERLSSESRSRDIFLVCQCEVGERCHREMLLSLAKERFGASVGPIFHSYPRFRSRQNAP